tara:strand:+ start:96 stop:749 length:654 start_codon:yes stop_codon:yes gene_type:complete
MSEELNLQFSDLPNIGILSTKLPTEMLNILTREVEKIISSNFNSHSAYNQNLLGHMQHEYDLDNCINTVEPFVLYLANAYNKQYNWFNDSDANYENDRPKQLKLTDLWVNIQKKHEFNPPHEHTGIMSFVIWIKIPYKLADEEAYFPPVSGNANRTSKFSFHYSNLVGQHQHYMIDVDKDHEGTIAMFPSKLNHSVNPFYTSDDYRISISGNIRLIS